MEAIAVTAQKRKVEVINQFGKSVMQVGGTVLVCVPSLKKI